MLLAVLDDRAGVVLLDDAALALGRAVYLRRGSLVVFFTFPCFLFWTGAGGGGAGGAGRGAGSGSLGVFLRLPILTR